MAGAVLLFIATLISIRSASAANYFVVAGGGGNCSGSSWTNAAGSIPATLNPGDIVYLGGSTGNLANPSNAPCPGERTHSFNSSGTSGSHIQIVKCTPAISACTSTAGWQAGYGANSALWYDGTAYASIPGPYFWVFCGSYYDILGGYGTADTNGSYGIIHRYPGRMTNVQVSNAACSLANYGNIAFQYLEVDGVNPNSTNNGANPGAGSWDLTNSNASYTMGPFTFDHVFVHDIAGGMTNPVGITGITISNSYIERNFTDSAEHSNGFNCDAIGLVSTNLCTNNLTIYNSVWKDISGTGLITCLNGTCNNWNLYNNVFYDHDGWASNFDCQHGDSTAHCSVSLGVLSDNNGVGKLTNANFIGNTIYNISSPINESCKAGVLMMNPSASGITVENNIWLNSCAVWLNTYYGAIAFHDYNQFLNSTPFFLCPFSNSCQDKVNTHEFQTGNAVTNPFVATSLGNFQLAGAGSNTPTGCAPGTNCYANGGTLTSPYNLDLMGTTRGGSNGWTMGAYQYGSGSSDTTPPTVAITSPSNGSTVSGTISIAGTAADNVAVANVQVSIDGGAYASASGAGNWTFSLNTTSSTNASHTITAKATDTSGNTATASVTVTVSNISGSDIYIAQNTMGADNGSDCNDAHSAAWFNTASHWGPSAGQIGPGNTVHLCGTFTGTAGATALTFQGGGASGNVLTLHFESGATLTAPYWSTSGAIFLNGFSHILVDGGTNGLVTATANGSTLANQQDSRGVVGGNPSGSDIEIKNLSITNMYVRTVNTDNCQCGIGIGMGNGSNSGFLVHNNTIHDAYEGISLVYAGASTNFQVYNNTIYRTSSGLVTGGGNSGVTLTTALFHDNEIYDGVNWDGDWTGLHSCTSDCHFHNQPIHIWAVLTGDNISGLQIYNNYLHGDWGAHDTTWIYPEGLISNHLIYNNILQNSNPTMGPTNGYILLKCAAAGCTNAQVYNNTIWSQAASSPISMGIELSDSEHNAVIKNNILLNVNFGIYVPPSDDSSIAASDNNDFYPSPNMYYHVGPVSLSSWTATWGFDAHSIASNPNLTSTYGLPGGSPAIGLGTNLTSLNIPSLDSGAPQTFGASGSCGSGCVARQSSWDAGTYQSGGAPPPPTITSALSASGTTGSAFSYQITASNSPMSFNATGLPAGLSVNTSNGLISGTPAAAGTSRVTLSATNAGGTASASLQLTVYSACDVNKDGQTNVVDVQLEVNMALGIIPCTNSGGTCTVVSVQRVVNAAIGGACVNP